MVSYDKTLSDFNKKDTMAENRKVMKRVGMKFLMLLSAWIISMGATAQNSRGAAQSARTPSYQVTGRVIDAETGEALELVNVTFNAREFWAVTNENGRFSLSLRKGTYDWSATYLGYEEAKGTLKIDGNLRQYELNIRMRPSTLALDEVSVTAREQAMGSSSVIDRMALQHLQPKSVAEMLQLMPGSITSNPSVNSVAQASIREVYSDNNNALGTAVLVDGTPISNDATLMTFNTAKSSLSGVSSQSTTGKGVDLRTISPDNVESMEVIRGIPSVEYGNLTSGAVIIKTKKGATPLEVKGKTDPNSKMIYAGKGFSLGSATTLNLALDYTSSYSDIRFKAWGYERITGNAGLSKTFFQEHPLSLNANLAYFQNLNTVRVDPQQMDSEKSVSDNKGIRFSLNGDWNIKQLLVSNLSYNLSVNYSHQRDTKTEWMVLKNGLQPIGFSLEEGEHEAPFLLGNYYSDYYIDGKPLSLFAQLKAAKNVMFRDNLSTAVKLGAEWAYDVNKGDGLVFDPYKPPVINDLSTVRPRSYSDIPAMNTLSGFIEDKTVFPIGPTSMTLQAGVRGNYLFIDKNYLNRSNILTIDPRFNAEWHLLTPANNRLLDDLSLTGGWGLTSKMPSLAYLYPDKAYFDEKSLESMSPYFAITTTRILESTVNVNIKPSRGRKMEIGLTASKGKVSGMVTFFYEKYTDEFNYLASALAVPYNSYTFSIPANARNLSYSGGQINYTVDDVAYTADPVSVKADTMFHTYSTPNNGRKSEKMGVEYTLNFGQLPYIKTSLVVDGAWLWTHHYNGQHYWATGTAKYDDYYPYIILCPGGSGGVESRINTNFRFVTHIPQLKMIFTTTAQVVWKEGSQTSFVDENGNNRWYLSENKSGKPVLAIDPIGYMDRAGNYYDWDIEYRKKEYDTKETQQYNMITTYSSLYYFEKETYSPYAIFNFRLTKEFGDHMEFSFMANNLFNTRVIHKNIYTAGYVNRTISQYFGAEFKIKI